MRIIIEIAEGQMINISGYILGLMNNISVVIVCCRNYGA